MEELFNKLSISNEIESEKVEKKVEEKVEKKVEEKVEKKVEEKVEKKVEKIKKIIKIKPLIIKEDKIMQIKKLTDVCTNLALLRANYVKCFQGYHLINSSPINETIWEEINSLIFTSSNIPVYSKSNGSHLSGMDINCLLGRISNKSAKYAKKRQSIDMSSYRLTTVCNEKNCGSISNIIQEINNRKNFEYYSCIIRDEIYNKEKEEKSIIYDWLLIPSNHIVLDPSSYIWEPMIGKRGKNKDEQIGWNTNEINGCKMSITFSMSSQLWIHIEMTEDIKQFIIESTTINTNPLYNYIQLVDLHKLESTS